MWLLLDRKNPHLRIERHHAVALGIGDVAGEDDPAVWLGITYGPATFFMGATTVLFLVAIHFSWELSRLEERTRVLAEELAVYRAEAEDPGDDAPATSGGEARA